ncbi:hypothetical protein ISCGN_023181 [Ixodes scapularis]
MDPSRRRGPYKKYLTDGNLPLPRETCRRWEISETGASRETTSSPTDDDSSMDVLVSSVDGGQACSSSPPVSCSESETDHRLNHVYRKCGIFKC